MNRLRFKLKQNNIECDLLNCALIRMSNVVVVKDKLKNGITAAEALELLEEITSQWWEDVKRADLQMDKLKRAV